MPKATRRKAFLTSHLLGVYMHSAISVFNFVEEKGLEGWAGRGVVRPVAQEVKNKTQNRGNDRIEGMLV